MNFISITGDTVHLFAILALLGKMWRTKSCAGLSAKTQVGYFLVFATRYLDLVFYGTGASSYYLIIGKCVFLTLSVITIVLIYWPYHDTYDSQNDAFYLSILVTISAGLALLVNHEFSVLEICWTFSVYLEAVVIIPQLIMISRTGKAETITYLYIIPLGLYKFCYIANWIYCFYVEGYFDAIKIVAGCIQTILYFVFLYLYSTMNGFEKLTDLSESDI